MESALIWGEFSLLAPETQPAAKFLPTTVNEPNKVEAGQSLTQGATPKALLMTDPVPLAWDTQQLRI